eukprot:TRINITY_DN2388_c0_g2_i1.p1 TRINITY_DN2388_c0_g2~~TRINITY_DN2388_c0_g2_i1.p1  ORF type:complete len:726 (+),score=166.90 TRINITY_DN2388_c0_g2_i1:42-2219(+)
MSLRTFNNLKSQRTAILNANPEEYEYYVFETQRNYNEQKIKLVNRRIELAEASDTLDKTNVNFNEYTEGIKVILKEIEDEYGLLPSSPQQLQHKLRLRRRKRNLGKLERQLSLSSLPDQSVIHSNDGESELAVPELDLAKIRKNSIVSIRQVTAMSNRAQSRKSHLSGNPPNAINEFSDEQDEHLQSYHKMRLDTADKYFNQVATRNGILGSLKDNIPNRVSLEVDNAKFSLNMARKCLFGANNDPKVVYETHYDSIIASNPFSLMFWNFYLENESSDVNSKLVLRSNILYRMLEFPQHFLQSATSIQSLILGKDPFWKQYKTDYSKIILELFDSNELECVLDLYYLYLTRKVVKQTGYAERVSKLEYFKFFKLLYAIFGYSEPSIELDYQILSGGNPGVSRERLHLGLFCLAHGMTSDLKTSSYCEFLRNLFLYLLYFPNRTANKQFSRASIDRKRIFFRNEGLLIDEEEIQCLLPDKNEELVEIFNNFHLYCSNSLKSMDNVFPVENEADTDNKIESRKHGKSQTFTVDYHVNSPVKNPEKSSAKPKERDIFENITANLLESQKRILKISNKEQMQNKDRIDSQFEPETVTKKALHFRIPSASSQLKKNFSTMLKSKKKTTDENEDILISPPPPPPENSNHFGTAGRSRPKPKTRPIQKSTEINNDFYDDIEDKVLVSLRPKNIFEMSSNLDTPPSTGKKLPIKMKSPPAKYSNRRLNLYDTK